MGSLIFLRFSGFFEPSNSQVIEPWGDGYKAYHAIFYHATYDSTFTHYQGMNYPYGEHVVAGACQPLLSNSIKILTTLGINVLPYNFGIFHLFLMISLLLSPLFLFLIFRRLGLPDWYSIIVAIGLAFLAPQLDRMISHYGLAHPELLPLVFYLLLRWHETPNWRWSTLIGLVVWSYSLIHFYYFAILAFAIIGWVAVRWLLQKDWSKTGVYLWNGILMLGIPLLFFLFWMILNDPVLDRNKAPWGFFAYRSKLRGIFTHLDIPYWQWTNDHLISIHRPNMEAQAYVGLVAFVFILIFIVKWGANLFKRWPLPLTNKKESYLQYLLLSSVLILIFAHGVPFIIGGFDRFLKYMGPIQQFRSIGRFAWVFYYGANISAFYYLFKFWKKRKANSLWKKAWIAIPLVVLLFESYQYSTAKNLALDEIEDYKEGHQFTDLDIDYSHFQAILPIPYFNIGSDNFWWPAKGWISQRPHTMSLQTGLPLTSAMLTRTSLSQTIHQLQLVTEPYRMPVILNDYPNDKPLLLFWDKERVHEYGDRYLHLNKYAHLLYQKDWMQLYELPLGSFKKNIEDQIQFVKQNLDSLVYLELHSSNNWMATDSSTQWYFDAYDQTKYEDAYMGAGEFRGNLGYWNRLVDTVWQSNYTGDITISFWQYINSDRASWTIITWTEYDTETGQELFKQTRNTRENIKVFDDKGWALVEFTLPKQRANSRIELILSHEVIRDGLLQVDELLIRPANVNIGRKMQDGLWWNNRYYF